MKKSIWIMLVLLFLLAACSSSQPEIVVETNAFDLGQVENGDIITKDILVSNNGTTPLEITDVSTSCGCTKADISNSTILPGESSILHIEFDSGAHGPELTGELIRQIFINSNDTNNPEVTIEFKADIFTPNS